MVSASIHTAEVFTSLASGYTHLRLGNVRKDIFLPLTFFGVIGGVLGAIGLVNMPGEMVRLAVSIVLLVMGTMIFIKFIRKQDQKPKEKVVPRKITPLGIVAGFIDALGGGGWGPICTPILMINGTEPRKVIGSVNLAEFFVTAAITITFILLIGLSNIPWNIVLGLAGAGVIMAPFTAWLVKKVSPRALGISIGIVIIALNINVLIKIL
ncbi:hypothetical protein ES708_32752 [subsurface metagenome]